MKNTMLAPNIRPAREPVQYEQIPLETNLTFQKPFVSSSKKQEAPVPVISGQSEPEEPVFIPDEPVKKESYSEPQPKPEESAEPVQTVPEAVVQKLPEMQVIGQLHDKFILCACEKGLAVIDQHAAQERVHYEQYCKALNQNPVMLECLVPVSLAAGDDLVRRIDELNAAAENLHIEFEAFGHDTLLVRRIPAWMKDLEEEPFLQDVLDNFRNERKSSYTKMEKKTIATMACHHSIRFNRSLTLQEMNEVVSQLNECENPYHCPHGRPTFVILEEKELAKEFLR